MDQQTYIVTVEGVSPADAQRYAEELRNALLDATPDLTMQRRRENPLTQDFGATLVLILGTPAVIVQNITSKNATELAQLLLSKQ